jgi:hypothetical protein
MWIASTAGFFSIVKKVDEKLGDSRRPYQIRARDVRDLEQLKSICPGLARAEIIHTPHADYVARITCGLHQLVEVLVQIGGEINYENFKGAIGNSPTQAQKLAAYHGMWGIMANHQRNMTHGFNNPGEARRHA